MTADLAQRLSAAALKRLGGSNLEYDAEKLEQLAKVAIDEQEAVVRAHIGLGVPWDDALVGKTLRSAPSTADVPEPVGRGRRRFALGAAPTKPPCRHVERRTVAELRPNRFNASLFPDSLGDASIAQIADDLARNGQRVPIEIMPDGEITDGERRWRGAQQLGWAEVDVVVGPILTEDEILDRVLDSCSSARQMSLREQVNVFVAVSERLKREAGRDVGRPDQIIPKGIIYLRPRSIKDAAAKRAGFSSTTLAVRAEAVFTRGSADLQAKVRDGSVTVTAAYDQLPKRPKTSAARDQAPLQDDSGGDDAVPAGEAPTTFSSLEAGATTPVPTSLPGDDATVPDAEAGASHTRDGNAVSEAGEETADEDEDEDEGEAEDSQLQLDDPIEDDEPDVGVHVSAVCQQLSRLAESNYEQAVALFDQVVDELRSSLGEPPELDD